MHRLGALPLLKNHLKSEKDYHEALVSVTRPGTTSSAALLAWGSAEAPDLAEATSALAALLASANEALLEYAARVGEARERMSDLKEREEEWMNVERDREILVSRLIKASNKKPSSHSSTPAAASEKLFAAQRELRACEAHLSSLESRLELDKRAVLHNALALRLRGMMQLGWRLQEVAKESLGVLERLSSSGADGADAASYRALPLPYDPAEVGSEASLAPSQSASQIGVQREVQPGQATLDIVPPHRMSASVLDDYYPSPVTSPPPVPAPPPKDEDEVASDSSSFVEGTLEGRAGFDFKYNNRMDEPPMSKEQWTTAREHPAPNLSIKPPPPLNDHRAQVSPTDFLTHKLSNGHLPHAPSPAPRPPFEQSHSAATIRPQTRASTARAPPPLPRSPSPVSSDDSSIRGRKRSTSLLGGIGRLFGIGSLSKKSKRRARSELSNVGPNTFVTWGSASGGGGGRHPQSGTWSTRIDARQARREAESSSDDEPEPRELVEVRNAKPGSRPAGLTAAQKAVADAGTKPPKKKKFVKKTASDLDIVTAPPTALSTAKTLTTDFPKSSSVQRSNTSASASAPKKKKKKKKKKKASAAAASAPPSPAPPKLQPPPTAPRAITGPLLPPPPRAPTSSIVPTSAAPSHLIRPDLKHSVGLGGSWVNHQPSTPQCSLGHKKARSGHQESLMSIVESDPAPAPTPVSSSTPIVAPTPVRPAAPASATDGSLSRSTSLSAPLRSALRSPSPLKPPGSDTTASFSDLGSPHDGSSKPRRRKSVRLNVPPTPPAAPEPVEKSGWESAGFGGGGGGGWTRRARSAADDSSDEEGEVDDEYARARNALREAQRGWDGIGKEE